MKTFILLTLLISLIGCNEEKKSDQAPNPVTFGTPEPTDMPSPKSTPTPSPEPTNMPSPEPTHMPEEILYVCYFNESINTCNINEYAKPRLIKLSQTGTVTSKMIELREVKAIYHLTDDQVRCLKENFCKEEY